MGRQTSVRIELCAIAEERTTAAALKVRITAMHERVVVVVAKLAPVAPAVPLVSAPPESGGLLPLAPARHAGSWYRGGVAGRMF
jgi:hypothetical protein